MASLNEELRDDAIRHQVHTVRFASSVNNTQQEQLAKMHDKISDRISRLSSKRVTDAALAKALADIKKINDEGYKEIQSNVVDESVDFGEYESDFNARQIESQFLAASGLATLPFVVDRVGRKEVRDNVTKAPTAGLTLPDWFKSASESSTRKITQAVNNGLMNGSSIRTIVGSITGPTGVAKSDRRNLEAVVRNVINDTMNGARIDTYKANKDILKGYQWVSTLDSRTSAICASLDGKVFPIDSNQRPPAHPGGCRSVITPVVKSAKQLGIGSSDLSPGSRASINGQVSDKTTYGEWLRRQPKDTIVDNLGATRAELFIKGDLTVDKFVDKSGNRLTLAQLKAKEPAAFKKAFN